MTVFDIDRTTGIGASEAAAVLGLSQYDAPATIWAIKTHQLPEKKETLPMKIGTLLEPLVAELYQDREGVRVRRRRKAYYDAEHPMLFAHVDRLAPDRLVEIKTSSRPNDEWGKDGTTDIPLEVMIQVLLQMRYAKRSRADVVALLYGRDLRVYPIEYDQGLADALVGRLRAWWDAYVVPGVEPPLDGSDAASEYIRRRYPQDNGETRVLMPNEEPLVRRLLAARADAARADQEKQAAENDVKHLMGAATALEYAGLPHGGIITWRTQTRIQTEWAPIAQLLATQAMQEGRLSAAEWDELVAGSTTAKAARYFRVQEKKDKEQAA